MTDLRLKYGPDYYKKIRKKVKSHPGGSFNSPELAKKAQALSVAARLKNNETNTTEDQKDSES